MTDSENTPPIDACFVALEPTDDYHFTEEERRHVKAVYDIFLYNRNEHTYCCELTPSYWLYYVDTQILFQDGAPDSARAAITGKYTLGPGDSCYVHVRAIDAIAANSGSNKSGMRRHLVHGATGIPYADLSYDEQIEDLIEQARGNPPL